MSFLITGLPRSRTAWFAAFFTALGYPCKHEMLRDCESEEDFLAQLQDYGNSDCGLCFYPGLQELDMPLVIIERDCNTMLKGLKVRFEDIDRRLSEIVEYCVGVKPDQHVVDLFCQLNIQLNQIKGPTTQWANNLRGTS